MASQKYRTLPVLRLAPKHAGDVVAIMNARRGAYSFSAEPHASGQYELMMTGPFARATVSEDTQMRIELLVEGIEKGLDYCADKQRERPPQ